MNSVYFYLSSLFISAHIILHTLFSLDLQNGSTMKERKKKATEKNELAAFTAHFNFMVLSDAESSSDVLCSL